MHRTTPVVAALFATLALPIVGSAAPDPTIPAVQPQPEVLADPTNAALVYYRAWMIVPDDFFKQVAEQYNSSPEWAPTDEFKELMRKHSEHVAYLAKASLMATADWGIEYSGGFSTLLPHLSKLRGTARILAADARCRLAANDPDGAAHDLAAAFGAAAHATRDRLIISPLVAIAIHSLACTGTQTLLKSGSLTAAGKQELLEAMRRFEIPDPFGLKAGVMGELNASYTWVERQYSGPDAGKRLASILAEGPENKASATIARMDDIALKAELGKVRRAYDDIIAAWDAPNADQKFADIQTGVDQGRYGVLAQVLIPALSKARTSSNKALKLQMETLLALQEYKPAAK